MSNFDDLLGFLRKHKGALIGGLIALIIACTRLYRVIVVLAIIIVGICAGDYVQKNREKVKDVLRKFIDKI